MINYRRNTSERDARANACGTHGGDTCGRYRKACGRIHGTGVRMAAVLLTLVLGVGGVCAAAENPEGQQLQMELSLQTAGMPESEQTDAGAAEVPETVQGTDRTEGADTGAAVVSEDIDSTVILEEEAASEAAGEIVRDDVESADAGTVPEIVVESIQVDGSETYTGDDIPVGEAELIGNEPTESENRADNELSETEDGTTASVLSGECGAQPGTVYWRIDEAGVLTIEGNGPMADWKSVEQTPWYAYLTQLREIVIAEGVTSVGEHAFSGAQTVEAVELAESIDRVGAFAFCQCSGFGSVTIG